MRKNNFEIQMLAGNALMLRFHVGFEIELPLVTHLPGQLFESSETHSPAELFSCNRPLLPLGTLNRTKHRSPTPQTPRRLDKPPHSWPRDFAH